MMCRESQPFSVVFFSLFFLEKTVTGSPNGENINRLASQVVTRRVFLKCLFATAFCSRSAGGLCRKTTATKLVTY